MDRVRLRRCAIVLATIGVAVGAVFRTAPAVAEPRHFSVPAGEAAQTLTLFGRQADRFVSYDYDRVRHQLTHALNGDFEIADALRVMLKGSGLDFRVSDSGGVFVTAVDHSAADARPPRFSQPPLPAVVGPLAPRKVEELSSIYVFARPWSGVLPTDTSVEFSLLSHQDIQRSGDATAADLLRPMTSNFGGGPTEDTLLGREAGTNAAFGTGINLRGLGSRATLVLVNGRRLAPSGSAGTFFDISSIPLSAIDQIQVLQDGDATLLGEDAIGGVVNFVLQGSAGTPETQANIGGMTKSSVGERRFSQSIVSHWDSGSVMFAGEYYERDALSASKRSQATSNLVPWGGDNLGNPAGNPGTLIDTLDDGTLQVWGLPAGQNGTGLKASQLTVGPNLHDRFQDATILPHQQRLSVVATGQQRVADDWNVWVSALASQRRVATQSAGLTAALTIPSTNPWYFNPGGGDSVQVLYGFGADLGPQTLDGEVNSGQFAVGFDHAAIRGWTLTGYLSYAGERQIDRFGNLVNFATLQAYIDSADPTTAFNAFGSGTNTNPSTREAIRSQQSAHYSSGFTTTSLSTSGPAFSLPAGDVALTVGTDYRIQTFKSAVSATQLTTASDFDESRRMMAGYAQAVVPLLGADADLRHPHRLELRGGVRDEFYSDVGHAFAPRLGLTWWATPDIAVRAGWQKLFRPPNLSDISEASNLSTIVMLPDTLAPNGLTSALVWTGGNRDLRPESAQSLTAGLAVSPARLPDLTASVTYFHTVFDQVIQSTDLAATALVDPQYNWLVSRNIGAGLRSQVCVNSQFIGMPADCLNAPIGALVDVRLHNAETLKTEGFDFAGRYELSTGIGRMNFGVESTYILRYAQANSPTTAITSLLSTAHNPPALRARATTGWERRDFWISTTLNYQGGYEDTDSIPHRPVSSWATWDVVLGYRLRSWGASSAARTQIVAAAKNVFNTDPPFINNVVESVGYDQENGDLFGRRMSIALQVQW